MTTKYEMLRPTQGHRFVDRIACSLSVVAWIALSQWFLGSMFIRLCSDILLVPFPVSVMNNAMAPIPIGFPFFESSV